MCSLEDKGVNGFSKKNNRLSSIIGTAKEDYCRLIDKWKVYVSPIKNVNKELDDASEHFGNHLLDNTSCFNVHLFKVQKFCFAKVITHKNNVIDNIICVGYHFVLKINILQLLM